MLDCFYPCFKLGLLLSNMGAESAHSSYANANSVDRHKKPLVYNEIKRLNVELQFHPNIEPIVSAGSINIPQISTLQSDEILLIFSRYRRELISMLYSSEHKVMNNWGTDPAAAARRMVTVWLDELLIKSEWAGRHYWLRNPIQSEWGEGRSGGLWFFTTLDQLNSLRRADHELAKVALRCISLGLTGCYGRDREGLATVRRNVQNKFGLKSDTPVFPPPLEQFENKKKYLSRFGCYFFVALSIVAFLVWLACNNNLNRRFDKIKQPSESKVRINDQISGLISKPGEITILKNTMVNNKPSQPDTPYMKLNSESNDNITSIKDIL